MDRNLKMDTYELAQEELGELVDDGFYGDEVKDLVSSFGKLKNYEYFAKSLNLWIDDNKQDGKDEVNKYINIFIKIIDRALKFDTELTTRQIKDFFKGSDDGKQAENLTAYMEYSISHVSLLKEIKEKSKTQPLKLSESKKIAQDILNTYAKGVEFISKIFSLVVILNRISSKQKIEVNNVNKLTLFKKCNEIESFDPQLKVLTDSLDRYVRNAESHLNITYNASQNNFIYKVVQNGKYKNELISMEEMLKSIFPQNGWVIQGFVYSLTLFLISLDDRELYLELINKIFI